ncbi:hypothetical protein [Corynebacterium pseudopelargi]|uniref:Uncharacterized protein n=1 Tax=Corynebacterium pseudopelargi TaxID=2080757 RepID=A0A3G6ISD8_9CORY|nr:hypothetical protein [Corynebacterium pseudopelargi]AZA08529.1 hypothetical protein CPPEL_01915 [Corynebacterium pseudopelargi]
MLQVNNICSRFASRDPHAGNTAFDDNIWALFTVELELVSLNTPPVPAQRDSPAGAPQLGDIG